MQKYLAGVEVDGFGNLKIAYIRQRRTERMDDISVRASFNFHVIRLCSTSTNDAKSHTNEFYTGSCKALIDERCGTGRRLGNDPSHIRQMI